MNTIFIVLFLFLGKNLVRQRDNVLIWCCKMVIEHPACKGAEIEKEVC